MIRMTCRDGFFWVAAICLGLMATSVCGGSLNPPAVPESASSAMWTLNDLYNVLDTHSTNVAKRAGAAAFAEPGGLPTNGTMRTLNEIMMLVTNRAPVPRTGVTPTVPQNPAPAGSDGNLQVGVAWPNPRFSPVAASGAETNQIRDNLTGLIWARNANFANGTLTWQAALDYIAATNASPAGYGGTNDWRLPNVRELLSLIAWQFNLPALPNTTGTQKWTEGNPFAGVIPNAAGYYWTSTATTGYGATIPENYAWQVWVYTGYLSAITKTTSNYVWPVRSGQR